MVLTGRFQFGVQQSTEVGNQMTSVERVIECSKLPSEAALESTKGFIIIYELYSLEHIFNTEIFYEMKATITWPHKGTIEFNGMSLRYTQVD